MKSIITLLFLSFLCTSTSTMLGINQTGGLRAQINVTHRLENARQSADGLAYEIDVMVSTTTPFKFGSGQLYFNYETSAFGTNIKQNNRIEVLRPPNSILATVAGFPVYQTPIVNDNTDSRVSIAYLQGTSAGCLSGPNVTETPSLLFTLRLVFLPGQAGTSPEVCFETTELFVGQTFTACGPDAGCAFADCQNNPGTQITADSYVCLNELPVELASFAVRADKADAVLDWTTAGEVGSSHFVIEKSADGTRWLPIGRVTAAGDAATPRAYTFTDHNYARNNRTVFYRLLMVDLDGSTDYSAIKSLTATPNGTGSLLVYPNPAQDWLAVSQPNPPAQDGTLSLHRIDGSLIFAQQADLSRSIQLDLKQYDLPPGVYLLRSSTGASQRIVLR